MALVARRDQYHLFQHAFEFTVNRASLTHPLTYLSEMDSPHYSRQTKAAISRLTFEQQRRRVEWLWWRSSRAFQLYRSQFFSFPWHSARSPREFNLWAGPLGYAVVRGRTKYRKDKSLQKAWVICDRGKKPKLSVAAADSKRPNRSSKKTGFSITLLEAYGKGCGLWAATLIDGDHNHPPSSDPADHCAIWNIYKGDGFKETVEAHKKTEHLGSHTLNVFEHEDPTIPLTSRDVYNQRAISRRQELNGRSPIETLFEMAGEDFHRWRHNSGHLSGLFLAYKPNRPLIANNPEVVIIDTYTTNMFKMPLVNFVGVTPNNMHFLMGCAFMPSDTVEEYRHALDYLIQLYESIEKSTHISIWLHRPPSWAMAMRCRWLR